MNCSYFTYIHKHREFIVFVFLLEKLSTNKKDRQTVSLILDNINMPINWNGEEPNGCRNMRNLLIPRVYKFKLCDYIAFNKKNQIKSTRDVVVATNLAVSWKILYIL